MDFVRNWELRNLFKWNVQILHISKIELMQKLQQFKFNYPEFPDSSKKSY